MDEIKTKSDYRKFFDHIVENAQKIIIRDGHHTSVFFLVLENGAYAIAPFDQIGHGVYEKLKSLGNKEPNPDHVKAVTFDAIGAIAKDMKCVGYIHVAEAWTISVPEAATDPDKAVEEINRVKEKYGGTLENVPGRLEILSAAGRFKGDTRMVVFKIKRLGDDICLEPLHDLDGTYDGPQKAKIQSVDDAIDATLGKTYPRLNDESAPEEPPRRIRW